MYRFGAPSAEKLEAPQVAELLTDARRQARHLAVVPLQTIIGILNNLSYHWQKWREWAPTLAHDLSSELSFSPEMISATLDGIPNLLAREGLLRRVQGEFGDYEILDRFSQPPGYNERVRAFPRGLLLHVAAGNVFVGCIDSLLMGFLTKNISLLKLSQRNQLFPKLFAETLQQIDSDGVLCRSFALLYWPHDDKDVETKVKNGVDTILAWGGEDMLASYSANLKPTTKLVDFGPRFSFQVVTKSGFSRLSPADFGDRVARDVCTWDQSACASPQNIFFEQGIDNDALLDAIAEGMARFPLGRGELSDGECVEQLKERFRAHFSQISQQGSYRQGDNFLLHLENSTGPRQSPLGRCLIIKPFSSLAALGEHLKSWSYYLQTCSFIAGHDEKEQVIDELGLLGVARFCALGFVTEGRDGAPHDDRYALRELVRFVGEESEPGPVGFVNQAIADVPYYRTRSHSVTSLNEMPVIDGRVVAEEGTVASTLLSDRRGPGRFFSSGGTTGKAKFSFYSHRDFARIAAYHGGTFARLGLNAGDLIANLFMAGGMWSSFLAIEKALEAAHLSSLPIGGQTDPTVILDLIHEFRPRAVFGIPALLVSLADLSRKHTRSYEIPMVCYAGEPLSPGARQLMVDAWNTQNFHSAGYASVDAGYLGYPCPHCQDGEHHLAADFVDLEIVDGEGVVTSRFRPDMPLIRYRTGDRMAWLTTDCPCGSRDPRFTLQGRVDGQLNLWGCRVLLSDFDTALERLGLCAVARQLVIDDRASHSHVTLRVEGASTPISVAAVAAELLNLNKDLRGTQTLEFLLGVLDVEVVAHGVLPRAERTGKVRPIVHCSNKTEES